MNNKYVMRLTKKYPRELFHQSQCLYSLRKSRNLSLCGNITLNGLPSKEYFGLNIDGVAFT